MGNTLFFNENTQTVAANAAELRGFRASSAADMQTQIRAALVAAAGDWLVDMSISGSGHTKQFVVKLLTGTTIGGNTPIDGSYKVFVYQGASRPEIQRNANAALAALLADATTTTIIGHGIAGASQGREFMGFFFSAVAPIG